MTKFYPTNEKNRHAKATGEFRCPRKGEWFLSGAIVEAYQARADINMPYHIAIIVDTETITIIREVKNNATPTK